MVCTWLLQSLGCRPTTAVTFARTIIGQALPALSWTDRISRVSTSFVARGKLSQGEAKSGCAQMWLNSMEMPLSFDEKSSQSLPFWVARRCEARQPLLFTQIAAQVWLARPRWPSSAMLLSTTRSDVPLTFCRTLPADDSANASAFQALDCAYTIFNRRRNTNHSYTFHQLEPRAATRSRAPWQTYITPTDQVCHETAMDRAPQENDVRASTLNRHAIQRTE